MCRIARVAAAFVRYVSKTLGPALGLQNMPPNVTTRCVVGISQIVSEFLVDANQLHTQTIAKASTRATYAHAVLHDADRGEHQLIEQRDVVACNVRSIGERWVSSGLHTVPGHIATWPIPRRRPGACVPDRTIACLHNLLAARHIGRLHGFD